MIIKDIEIIKDKKITFKLYFLDKKKFNNFILDEITNYFN